METFQPSNPDFRERVHKSFQGQPMLRTIGAVLSEVGPGFCEVHLPFRKDLTQHHGYLHGGAYALLADTAGGYAAYTLLAPSDSAMTVEYKLNMLRPGQGELFIARASVIKPGKTLIIVKADLFSRQGNQEALCATSLQTIIVMKGLADNASSAPTELQSQTIEPHT